MNIYDILIFMDPLVSTLCHTKVLHTPRVREAFETIPRIDFIPEESKSYATLDEPIHIGFQQTISQPSTVAFMLELLQPQLGDTVLDIGSGSGWTTALLGHIVGPEGSVLGLERIPELTAFGNENLTKQNLANAHIERAGTELGAPSRAPFNKILVSASARSFPHELVTQLKEYGTLVIPVRDAIWKATRAEHQPIIEKYDGYVFVPLIVE